jgi:hypothetical protein
MESLRGLWEHAYLDWRAVAALEKVERDAARENVEEALREVDRCDPDICIFGLREALTTLRDRPLKRSGSRGELRPEPPEFAPPRRLAETVYAPRTASASAVPGLLKFLDPLADGLRESGKEEEEEEKAEGGDL